jgi:hypothetical protein
MKSSRALDRELMLCSERNKSKQIHFFVIRRRRNDISEGPGLKRLHVLQTKVTALNSTEAAKLFFSLEVLS